MKITIFATVALTAVIGMAFADEMFNNWNNNNNNAWGNDDGFGGISHISGGLSSGLGSGFSSGYGAAGYGAGYSSGYGAAGYGSGYSSGYGAGSYGYGSGMGSGYGKGMGMAKAAYIPVPATQKAGGAGISSILPIFFLLFLLPQLFNRSSGRDQIILLNSTLN